ncbi:cupin domain-containing protein [Ancylobacter radicis]|uniref:Cupin domain-containing protein n=1 Tax=Ancylobacter radicis TaxID=2836179 RepID=A0ABS5RAF6_9HYPH|nr:cupin domain-containing protein [Ancylobacter radicis]MBS9478626.1 cupin domain-containing protein [Ancylobacter radicis]
MVFACTIPARPTTLADDERVRITRWDFEPGATTGWHEHAMDYAIVFVTDGLMEIDVDGTVTQVAMAAGAAYSRPAGIRHDVRNAGDAPMSFVEVEMK